MWALESSHIAASLLPYLCLSEHPGHAGLSDLRSKKQNAKLGLEERLNRHRWRKGHDLRKPGQQALDQGPRSGGGRVCDVVRGRSHGSGKTQQVSSFTPITEPKLLGGVGEGHGEPSIQTFVFIL